MCTTSYFYFCVHYSVLTTKNLVSICRCTVDPLYPFHPSPIPTPSPLVTTTLFSVSTYLVLFDLVCSFILFVLHIPHMSEIIWYLSFSIWLISLSIIPSRSIYAVANGKISSFLFFFFIYLFIYFILFLAALGPRCCVRALSSCGEWEPLFVAVRRLPTAVVPAVAEHRLQSAGSVVVARGLSSCGSRALEGKLSSCGTRAQLLRGMWDLPRPGLEPTSPALAGGFLTTAPPGKPSSFLMAE